MNKVLTLEVLEQEEKQEEVDLELSLNAISVTDNL
jgi:hypothetical protein